jgi:hypothetical protein
MHVANPKAMLPKALPLILSLVALSGLLPVSPLGSMLIKEAGAAAAARGPRGGAAVSGPRGTAAVGPGGTAVAATPRNYVHSGSATVTAGPRRAYVEGPRGGEAYVGPRGAAVQGPGGGTAVVRTVPVGARAVAVAGVTYYVASGVYYRPVYQGSEVVYQQVPPPPGAP